MSCRPGDFQLNYFGGKWLLFVDSAGITDTCCLCRLPKNSGYLFPLLGYSLSTFEEEINIVDISCSKRALSRFRLLSAFHLRPEYTQSFCLRITRHFWIVLNECEIVSFFLPLVSQFFCSHFIIVLGELSYIFLESFDIPKQTFFLRRYTHSCSSFSW